jgi:signal transduction histidine kinase/tetratricopeptide (TPR) repeat protein
LGEELAASAEGRVYGDRFKAVRLLKHAQGVETWLAEDLSQPGPVVLKTLAATTVPRSVQHRLEHEANVLRELDSRFLTPLRQVGREGGLLYFAVPFVAGTTLERRLQDGPLSALEAINIGCCVLSALEEAHEHGVLHRDVKPANVIVATDAALGEPAATLIDFGLARSGRIDAGVRDEPVGSVRYVSPEQAGLLDANVDERSDLYSFGALLFESLAGRPLFDGGTITEVLRQHMTAHAPDLRGLAVVVPRALEELLRRLLQKDPRDRYQSAEGALHDLRAIGEALAEGRREPSLVLGLHDRRRTLTEPELVGRTADLTLLESHLERARRGRGGLVLLEAESGGGKTRLLDELAQKSWRSAWVLRGQGVAAAASTPFQMLSGVASELVVAAGADAALAASLRESLGDRRQAVCAALPELAAALEPPTGSTLGPEAFGETRTIAALDQLVRALGTEGRPAVVILDDCQWADDSSLKLLRHFARNTEPLHVLVIASFRSEEVDERHPLRALEGAPRLVLAPLDAGDIRRLVESMAGALPALAVSVVEELSGGSPFMASAVLRGMVECEALVQLGAGWQVNQTAIADVRSSRRAAAFLVRRVELLPAPVLDLLSVGAVLGREFDLDFAATLVRQTPGQALHAITEARTRHMIWTRNEDARCVFVHDKVREALLERLTDEQRRRLHHEAASLLEGQAGDRAFEIAYHYDAAGEPGRALPHALSAGDQARAQHALELAEQQYRIAERGAALADATVRLCIAEGLGDVLTLRGRYSEAAPQFEAARALAASDTSRAQIEGKLGDLAFKRGDVETASQALERGLRLLGRRVPRTRLAALVMCLWEVGVQAMHTLFPRLLVGRRRKDGAEREFLAIRLHSRMAHAYWFARGKIPCAWTHLRGLNLAERYPPTAELAQAYSEHAPVVTMLPWYERGIAYAQRSLAIRRAQGDVWGQGQSLHFYGIVLYAASRFAESLERCHEAVKLLERTGDRWELNTAGWHIAFSLYRLGYRAGAVESARQVHENGAAIGDQQAMGISLGAWAKASGGDVPRELVQEALARDAGDVHTAAEVMQAEALRLLKEGQPGAAAGVLARADRLVQSRGLRQEYVAPVLTWLATALRTELEGVAPYHPQERRRLLRQARQIVRRALRVARHYRNNLPHALREAALIQAMDGRPRRARRLLARSLSVAEVQGARAEHAQSLLVQGRLGMLHGWPEADLDIASAERALDSQAGEEERLEAGHITDEVTLSLVDRFDQVLENGRRIASALSKEAILTAVREAAEALLRGERCALVELSEDGSMNEALVSRQVVEQAVSTGKPVVVAEGAGESASESLILSGLRSILCAPIFVRARAVACLYVTHSRVGRLFGEEEERLAQFIGTLAGAALENAAGFAQIEEAVRMRDEFLAIASHELKTPLTPLQLQIDDFARVLRRRGVDDDAVTQRLTIMVRQTTRLSKLVENLLDLSRIAAGRLTLQPEEFDFTEMVRDVARRMAPEAEHLGCGLEIRAGEAIRGRWDQLRLEQVVSNLLANAIKYGAAHPIEIEVQALDDAPAVRLRMRDHGIGMSAQDAARVFERFERAVSVRHYGGLGLGLYITRQIVEAHGGQITVESRPGEGATFTVILPITTANASSTEAA